MLSKIINLIYKDDSRTFKIRFLLALLVDFTFAFSVFAFIPYEVYLGNTIVLHKKQRRSCKDGQLY